jgi:hypothetical protein
MLANSQLLAEASWKSLLLFPMKQHVLLVIKVANDLSAFVSFQPTVDVLWKKNQTYWIN